MLDEQSETFAVHLGAQEAPPKSAKMTIHPSQAAQLLGDDLV